LDYVRVTVASLVQALEQNLQTPALTLPILPEQERVQILQTFNATATPYPSKQVLHELFEQQVQRTPEATAVVFEDQALTYAELNARANQLARHLRHSAIGPDQLVGICVERSLEMVVGLLGVLKAGGAYLPMDPTYPAERLAYMLADAAPRVLLSQQHLLSKIPDNRAQIIALDADWPQISTHDSTNLDSVSVGLSSHHLAYVIYTSGSTGKPKGVMIEHAAVLNFLTGMQQHPGIKPTDCLLAVTTISFDIAGLELYLPLLHGATVLLASREDAQDASRLIGLMENSSVTLMQATPATWHLLLNFGWQGRPELKALCGGEALNRQLSAQLLDRVGALWNLYGPTETTIWSCNQLIIAGPEEQAAAFEPIGRPIANTQIYLLDAHNQPVPMGVQGEVYIGGAGVARGYLNRPELTAARFLPDPFSAESTAKMYRTGDLGRWRADGTLEYLGRNDHQVKIRGFRIELGEIEAQLSQHPGVAEAVVLAREDVPGEKRLVAYITARPASTVDELPNAEELREYLKPLLPEHMLPSAFVRMQSLPLTPNGKLDRRALPAPSGRCGNTEEYVAPGTRIERTLAALWSQILHVDRVSIYDNFFELGGHSLLGMKLIGQLSSTLYIELPVATILQCPTIKEMAGLIERELSSTQTRAQIERPGLESGVI
jgi:amino acid adenylation domain-containing protein